MKTFNYKVEGQVNLTSDEIQELIQVDEWAYPLMGYKCLGELHDTIDVIISDKQPKRETKVRYTLGKLKKCLEEAEHRQQVIGKQLEQPLQDEERSKLGQLMEGLGCEINRIRGKIEEHRDKGDNEVITETITTSLLGEYKRDYQQGKTIIGYLNEAGEVANTKEGKVIIYKRNIDSIETLVEVYVHEMMHAYSDHDHSQQPHSISYIEEPIVEFGMLRFMAEYDGGKWLQHAESSVDKKRYAFGIGHYGFGYYLYKVYPEVPWTEMLYKQKYSLDNTMRAVQEYCNCFESGIYPFGKEQQTAEILIKVFNDMTITQSHLPSINKQSLIRYVALPYIADDIIRKVALLSRPIGEVYNVRTFNAHKSSLTYPAVIWSTCGWNWRCKTVVVKNSTDPHPHRGIVLKTSNVQEAFFVAAWLNSEVFHYIYSHLCQSISGLSLNELRSMPIPQMISKEFIDEMAKAISHQPYPLYYIEEKLYGLFGFNQEEIQEISNPQLGQSIWPIRL